MKRDLDLIRALLIAAEDRPPGAFSGADIVPDGSDAALVAEHLILLIEAGYLEGEVEGSLSASVTPARIYLERLTWSGHDLLAAIRSDTIWARTKERISSIGGSVALEVVKRVATDIATGYVT